MRVTSRSLCLVAIPGKLEQVSDRGDEFCSVFGGDVPVSCAVDAVPGGCHPVAVGIGGGVLAASGDLVSLRGVAITKLGEVVAPVRTLQQDLDQPLPQVVPCDPHQTVEVVPLGGPFTPVDTAVAPFRSAIPLVGHTIRGLAPAQRPVDRCGVTVGSVRSWRTVLDGMGAQPGGSSTGTGGTVSGSSGSVSGGGGVGASGGYAPAAHREQATLPGRPVTGGGLPLVLVDPQLDVPRVAEAGLRIPTRHDRLAHGVVVVVVVAGPVALAGHPGSPRWGRDPPPVCPVYHTGTSVSPPAAAINGPGMPIVVLAPTRHGTPTNEGSLPSDLHKRGGQTLKRNSTTSPSAIT
jgi:hypothetical protein